MLNSLKKLIPNTFKQSVRTVFMTLNTKIFNSNNITFSQSGEDIILRNIFIDKSDGFYVDIGAFHPVIVSNTHYFHTFKNWRGINLDARPNSMKLFNKLRPNDINLEIALSDEESELTFYFFDDSSTMNTFSKEFIIENNMQDKVQKEIKIKTKRLDDTLDKHLPQNTKIDFMSVDAEGLDLMILQSNNWNKYRPTILIVETSLQSVSQLGDSDVVKFMESKNYEIISVIYQEENIKNLFFKDMN